MAIREILSSIEFRIVDELIVNEKNKLYDLIIIEPGLEEYSKLEMIYGPINLRDKPHFFVKRIEKEINRLMTLLPQISSNERIIAIKARILLLEEALR